MKKNNVKGIPTLKRQQLASAIAAIIYSSLVLAPAYASDTEIYTQTNTSAASSPTVFMVLDTSGSMQYCIDSVASSTCSTVANRRINVLRSALNTVLMGKTGATPETTISPAPGFVKMGYARFNPDANKGGWVRYPARPLDAFIEVSPDGYNDAYGKDSKSDTTQTLTTANDYSSSTLTIGGLTDAKTGLFFDKVMIPKGATITSAYIELTAAEDGSASSEWLVSVEDSDSPADYSSVAVNSRTYSSTNASVVPSTWYKDQKYQIPITSIVSSKVNKSTWCGGSPMAFKIENKALGAALRKAYAYSATTANNPKLHIAYSIDPNATDSCIVVTRTATFGVQSGLNDIAYTDTSSSVTSSNSYLYVNDISSGNKTRSAVRFPEVHIGKNATINSATLNGVGVNSSASNISPQNVDVSIYNTGNLASFCSSSSSCTKPSAAMGSTKVWALPTFTKKTTTPISLDVTSLVQEGVNNGSWASKNAMGFRLSNNTSTSNSNVAVAAAEYSLASAITLSVNWTETLKDLSTLKTVREDILDDLNILDVSGGTPLGAAYAEASRYMLGMVPGIQSGLTADFTNISYPVHDPRVLNSAKTQFISPVDTQGCSGNYIFMMSDGEPNDLANVNSNTKGITGASCSNETAAAGNGKQLNWYCMFDLAMWNLSSNNQKKVPIHTTTVYFGPTKASSTSAQATITENVNNMKMVATKGDGDAFQATDEAKLVEALTKTIKKAIDAGGTISAPGVAVNQLNRLNHLDQLYYAVFEPKPLSYRWDGNLKRYKLAADGSAIVDVNDDDAIDPSTGFFKKGSQSFWSPTVDGDKATDGGAASVLPKPDPSSASDTDYRKMYTYLGGLSATNAPLDKINVGNTAFDNSAKTLMGITDNNKYTNLMNWYKGYNIPQLDGGLVAITSETLLRHRLGGALHSQPVLVNYGYNGSLVDAENPDNQKNVVFFSTLGGILHGVDAKTGKEKFSFIPGEKLSTLEAQYNNVTSTNPEFGMDVTWTYFRKDIDSTGQIDAGDKIYLYGGMRMGGKNYYALDLTTLESPKLLFAINGGTGKYASMGQTWSQPVVTTVKVNGAQRKVLVFGGGYDERHENLPDVILSGNDKGNQLYIVDAYTGEYLWSVSGNSGDSATILNNDMKFSIPTAPKVIDVDADGIADAIYFGDLGGQLFRADINNSNSAANDLVKRVKLLAKTGETVTATSINKRRFFEPPSLALFKDSTGTTFATVAQGSGYRSHPLNTTIDEHFYVFFDYDLPRKDLISVDSSALQAVITNNDLVKLDLNSTVDQTNGVDVTGKKGWYVDLPESGEKSLAPSLTYKSKLLFSTYVPVVSGSTCSPVIGKTKLYTFCMPYGKLCSTTSSYAKDNVMVGLGGEPQLLIIPDPSNPGQYKTVLVTGTAVDTTIFSDAGGTPILKSGKKWREKTKK